MRAWGRVRRGRMAVDASRLNYDEITIVHFTLGLKTETALVPKSASTDEIKGEFMSKENNLDF